MDLEVIFVGGEIDIRVLKICFDDVGNIWDESLKGRAIHYDKGQSMQKYIMVERVEGQSQVERGLYSGSCEVWIVIVMW